MESLVTLGFACVVAGVVALAAAHLIKPERFRQHSPLAKSPLFGKQKEMTTAQVRFLGAFWFVASLALLVVIAISGLARK
jgi:hypothetical protein